MFFLRSWRALLLVIVVGGALVLAPGAMGGNDQRDDDDREFRAEGRCSGASEWSLRLRADDGEIRVEFEIDARRPRTTWRVIILHDRRIAFSRTVQARGTGTELRLRRVLTDWYGRDSVTVRATGPRSEICRVSATV